jgi:N-acetylneuraminic acid mutarotase
MIVWGGNDSTGPPVPYASTGGRYDPSADTWLATNTAGAPTGRTFHTAVWTGSEMLVWGGALSNPAGPTATGSRYNPSTDSWSAITLFNAPSARSGHAAVWTGSLMLIWGGTYNGARYRPATNTTG